MDLTAHTRRLADDLQTAAALGDDATRTTAAALAAATENSARLMLLAALAEFAAEVSAAVPDREVHVRLDGTDAVVDVRPRAGADARTESAGHTDTSTDTSPPDTDAGPSDADAARAGSAAGTTASDAGAAADSTATGKQTDKETGEQPPEPDAATPSFEELTGDISRVTLRLVEQLKSRAEEAAAANGQSLNSWLSQAVQGAVSEHRRRGRGSWPRDDR